MPLKPAPMMAIFDILFLPCSLLFSSARVYNDFVLALEIMIPLFAHYHPQVTVTAFVKSENRTA
jgi:hypothetical protein